MCVPTLLKIFRPVAQNAPFNLALAYDILVHLKIREGFETFMINSVIEKKSHESFMLWKIDLWRYFVIFEYKIFYPKSDYK